ncbi:MAG: hypothetical protein HY800_09190, partial [Ignavibacteriales bacterium]|nr:hypothetical protein [Ignavibacteriales bacterium]
MIRIFSIFIIFAIITTTSALCQEAQWFKGNTHAHTTRSDGNEPPRRVVRWYFDHEYNFLVVTDHDKLTDIQYLDTDK